MCPSCHHELAAKDLVPLFSWVWLRGKCRYCKAPISAQYPLVEAATAALFVFSYFYWPYQLSNGGLFRFVLWLIFLTGFMALVVYDLKWFLLPNRIVFPLAGLAALQVIILKLAFNYSWSYVLGAAIGVAIISGLFYVLFQISNGTWIGGGDVKLGLVLGLLVGGPTHALLVLFLSSLLGTLAALPMLVQGRANRKTALPFGPLLIGATMVTVLFGSSIISWYIHLIGA